MHAARFDLTPYYEIIDTIMPLRRLFLDECASLDTHGRLRGRQMVEFNVRYNHSMLLSESKRQKVPSFNVRGVMRFCKADEMRCDEHVVIVKDAFPLHLNIDLNNTLISLPNLLPNDRFGKDGRRFPRPVDLSEGLIENPIITNRMYMSWVQDESRRDEYYFAIYLVRLRSCEELTRLLLSQHISSVKTTLSLVYNQCVNLNGAVDDDIMLVNTSINMSLNCPVSRARMRIPIRGQHCNHLQCFDCMTYIVMNYNKPTWRCPVCDKKTFFCYVEVDGLISNILKDERSNSVEHIQFNKSGQWRPMNMTPGNANGDSPYYDIKEYIKHKENDMSANKTPLLVTNESTANNSVETYLNQFLNFQKAYMPNHNLKSPSNINQQNRESLLTSKNDVNLHRVKDGHNPVNMDIYRHSLLSPNAVRSRDKVSRYLSSNVIKEYLDEVNNNQGIDSRPPPQYHYNYHPQKQKLTSSKDMASNIQITNVTSLGNHDKDVIVISDDEDDYVDLTSSMKSKTGQKRPVMVPSAQSDVGVSKQMKFADKSSMQYRKAHFASLNEIHAQSQFYSKPCKCSPGRFCSPHCAKFAYITKVIADTYPTVAVANNSNPTNVVTSSTVSQRNPNPGYRKPPNGSMLSQTTHGDVPSQSFRTSGNNLKTPDHHVQRSIVVSEFNQAFLNSCILGNHRSELMSGPPGYPGCHGSIPGVYRVPELPNKGSLTNNNSNNPMPPANLQAQWIQLINNYPMPPAHAPSLSSCKSYPGRPNVFYTGEH